MTAHRNRGERRLSETSQPAWTNEERQAVERFDPSASIAREWASVAVAAASRTLMTRLNTVHVHHRHRFEQARQAQDLGRGLLTFSNHVGLFDDPWLLSCFCGPEWGRLRWIAADALNFYGSPLRARISGAGKAVPIARGAGLNQPGMHFLAGRLQAGEWVHIFPEGGRSRDPNEGLRLPLKPGIAHLIQQSSPMVLGFTHRGMAAVNPIGRLLPGLGHTVHLDFGRVHDSADGLADAPVPTIMSWVEHQMIALASGINPAPGAPSPTS